MECTWSDGRPRPSSEDRVSSSVSARVHCFIPGPSRVPGAQVTLGTNAEVAFCRSDYQAVVRHMSELAREMERQSGKESFTSGRTCPDCVETIREAKLIQTSLLPTPGLRNDSVDIAFRFLPFSAGSFPVERASGAATHQGPLLFDLVRSFQPCHAGTHLLQYRDAIATAGLRKRVPGARRGWISFGNVSRFHLRTARRAACPRRLRSVCDRRSS
jgi:hypothetical protein